MPRKKKVIPEVEKEEMVSIYDPGVDSFREVSLSIAKKYLAELENLKKKIEEE